MQRKHPELMMQKLVEAALISGRFMRGELVRWLNTADTTFLANLDSDIDCINLVCQQFDSLSQRKREELLRHLPKTVTEIDLNARKGDMLCFDELVRTLECVRENMPQITKITLSHNLLFGLDDYKIKKITESLPKNIEMINMDANDTDKTTYQKIILWLEQLAKECKKLREISLQANTLGLLGAEDISHVIQSIPAEFEVVDLRGNQIESYSELMSVLSSLTSCHIVINSDATQAIKTDSLRMYLPTLFPPKLVDMEDELDEEKIVYQRNGFGAIK